MQNFLFTKDRNDILSIPANKRVFIFWQCFNGRKVPGYIRLCIETLKCTNPDMTICFLNYDNIYPLLGDVFDWKGFEKISPAMQSDVLKVFFLYEFGGAIFDADTIFVGKVELFSRIDDKKLYMFGMPGKAVQCGILISMHPKNVALWHLAQMQKERLTQVVSGINPPWDYFANSIFDPAAVELAQSDIFSVIQYHSMWLETKLGYPRKFGLLAGRELFQRFFFTDEVTEPIDKILSIPKYGFAYLHNCWAPSDYSQMSCDEFIKCDITLAKIFRYIIDKPVDDSTIVDIPISENTHPLTKEDHRKRYIVSELSRARPRFLFMEYSQAMCDKYTDVINKFINPGMEIECKPEAFDLLITAVDDNIRGNKPPDIPVPEGRIIAWGVLGIRSYRLLKYLKGTKLEPDELWDIAGDGVEVIKPNPNKVTMDDLVLVLPENGDEITAQLSNTGCIIISSDEIVKYAAAHRFSQFYDGRVDFIRKENLNET